MFRRDYLFIYSNNDRSVQVGVVECDIEIREESLKQLPWL